MEQKHEHYPDQHAPVSRDRHCAAAAAAAAASQAAAKSASAATSDGAGKTMSLDEFQKAAMKLKILLDNGIISQAEFDEEKKRLVDSMQL